MFGFFWRWVGWHGSEGGDTPTPTRQFRGESIVRPSLKGTSSVVTSYSGQSQVKTTLQTD